MILTAAAVTRAIITHAIRMKRDFDFLETVIDENHVRTCRDDSLSVYRRICSRTYLFDSEA